MNSGTAEVLKWPEVSDKKNHTKQWLRKYHRDTLRLTNTNHTNTMGSVEVLQNDYQFINGNKTIGYFYIILQKEFEDTKGIIRIRKSKKDRNTMVKRIKDKSTNDDLQHIYITLKTE